ncbi:MAG TPA: DUF2336 domain-containing protein [Rhizomicrobium sp.]|nr:DUF2336 domain-containing protein [Rhizomicrobium sp.]
MLNAKERLTRLVSLAAEPTVEARNTMIGELTDFLANWPDELPHAMRATLENLLRRKQREAAAGNLDERALLEIARSNTDWAVEFAGFIGVDLALTQKILHEPTGQALAMACKAAYLSRTAFSALAVLAARDQMPDADDMYAKLANYDAVSRSEAIATLEDWRQGRATRAA